MKIRINLFPWFIRLDPKFLFKTITYTKCKSIEKSFFLKSFFYFFKTSLYNYIPVKIYIHKLIKARLFRINLHILYLKNKINYFTRSRCFNIFIFQVIYLVIFLLFVFISLNVFFPPGEPKTYGQ